MMNDKSREKIADILVSCTGISSDSEFDNEINKSLSDIEEIINELISKQDEESHLIGFKNGKMATKKRVNDIWVQLMIDEVGSEKAFAYRDAIDAEFNGGTIL